MVRNEHGEMQPLDEQIQISDEIFDILSKDKEMVNQVRIAGPCEQKRCSMWGGKGCTAITEGFKMLDNMVKSVGESRFAKCTLNTACRWYIQESLAACSICTNVDYFEYV